MIIVIYALTAMSAILMITGAVQIRFQKMQDEYSRINSSQYILRLIEPLIQILAFYLQSLDQDKIDRKFKKKLVISGNPLRMLPVEFLAFKCVCSAGGCMVGLFLYFTTDINILFSIILMLGGYLYPNHWLNETIAKRKQSIFNSLPYCMDLMKLSVDAGMSFRGAIANVVEKGPKGPLRDEMEKLLQDFRLGKLQRDALVNLADRTDMYEIRSFVSALIMAEKLGTPLAETLEIQSDVRRNDRIQKVEKIGNEAPIKMLLPLMLFILPSVFIIMLMPIYLKFRAEGM